MTAASPPVGIDRERHQDLRGRDRHVWQRRLALVLVTAIPVLGLFDVFGQRAAITEGRGGGASLRIDSPARVRGGLIFTTKFMIGSSRGVKDGRLFLASGWFDGMTFNAIAPQPSTQSSTGHWVVLDFGQIDAGQDLPVWISWQTNPTDYGRHAEDVALYDGPTRLVSVHRTLTVFP
jgi:hypothetical protein